MATHRDRSSDLDPVQIDELIEDARQVPQPARRVAELAARLPRQRRLTVPDSSITVLAGYADYGC